MASKFVLAITVNTDANTVASEIAPTGVGGNPFTGGPDAWDWIQQVCSYIQKEAMGRGFSAVYFDTAVAASTTGTFTGNPSNTQTMSINGVTFTATTGTPTNNQFKVGTTVAANAANLAAAVNASTSAGIIGVVGATSAAGVVTFFALVPGQAGANIPISNTNLANFSVAASTFTTGGTQAHSAIVTAGATAIAA